MDEVDENFNMHLVDAPLSKETNNAIQSEENIIYQDQENENDHFDEENMGRNEGVNAETGHNAEAILHVQNENSSEDEKNYNTEPGRPKRNRRPVERHGPCVSRVICIERKMN